MGKLRKDQLELLRKIVHDPGEGVGDLLHEDNVKKLRYGDFLIFAFWKEAGLGFEKAVFRLLQIRKGEGDLGSDVFVGRCPDGELILMDSTSFRRVKNEYKEDLGLVYDTHDAIEIDDDHKVMGYIVNGKREVGFVVPK